MIKVLTGIFGIVLFLMSIPGTEAKEMSRLWEIKRKNSDGNIQIFHVLGVTHNGIDAEYDSYFYKKVIPVFKKAKYYSFESATLVPELVPDCPLSLPDTAGNARMLNRAREMVSNAYYAKFSSTNLSSEMSNTDKAEIRESQRIFANQMAEKLSEYGLVLALKERLAILKREQPVSRRDSVADYLFLNKGDILTASIDTPEEMIDAYCGQKSTREDVFANELKIYEAALKSDFAEPEILSFERDFRLSLEEKRLVPELKNGSKEYWDNYVCKRNVNWVKRIITDKKLDGKFFALGLAHLLPSSWNSCPTLLNFLQEEGMQVRILE